jgi:hypothetical protein
MVRRASAGRQPACCYAGGSRQDARARSFQLPSCFCQTCMTLILVLVTLPSSSLSETQRCRTTALFPTTWTVSSGHSSDLRNEHCRRRPSCIGGTQLIDDHEVTQIALPQEQTHPTGRARACGRLSQPASNRRCPMNLPSAIPPGQAKSPPPVWVTNWFSMSNFANLSKILMKPVRRSRW